jgi:hypothetical protein
VGEIDYSTGTLTFKLTNERARKRGDNITVTDDMTWDVDQDMVIKALVVYGEVRVRDWRWLWLRRKSVMIPFTPIRL